ncbi:hypothetical protein BGZ54_010002 [Gamsiella multidivaricata]|nr:hypothetical protein BGZ54_010002 [Gamsiella multidivaricata]
MERSVRASNTTLATTIFVESKAINSTIDLLACSVGQTIFSHGKVPLVCIYTNINIIMTKRQEINSLISCNRLCISVSGIARSELYPDWDASKLYVVYDTMDQGQGFEIPLWLLICMGVVAAVCLATWMYALILLPERCTSSLYKVLTMQLAPEVNSSAPMLIKSKMNPMEFEGHRAMLELEECELKTDDSASTLAASEKETD